MGDLTNDQLDVLNSANYENTPEFSLKNFKGWGKVVSVYDGDTVHVATFIYGQKYRIRCRLAGIDAAEMNAVNSLEKAHAVKAKNRMIELCKNDDQFVWIHVLKEDKYGGRYVTMIYPDMSEEQSKSFNQIMINEGLAYNYDGKTKKKEFKEWYKK